MTRYRKGLSVLAVAAGAILLVGQAVVAASGPQSDSLTGSSLNTQIWTKTVGPAPTFTHSGWLTLSTVHAPVAGFATTPPDAVLQPVSSSADWTINVQT